MKILPLSHLLLAPVAVLVSACGTLVHVQHTEPSSVGLPRGTELSVSCEHPRLAQLVTSRLAEEKFYRLTPAAGTQLQLGNVVKTEQEMGGASFGEQHRYARARNYIVNLSAVARLVRGGNVPFLKIYSIEGDSVERAQRKLADAVADDMVPRRVTRGRRISPASGNEVLGEAARACAAGNWQQGRTLAQQAVQAFPSDSECYFLMGLIEQQAGNYAAAAVQLRRALSLKDDSAYRDALSICERLSSR